MTTQLGSPLTGQAAGLLLRMASQGIQLRRDGADLLFRPVHAVQGSLLAQLRAFKLELLNLLDEGVESRRRLFEQQLSATAPPAIPAFLFCERVPYQRGRCFSCGEALPTRRWGRCWRCSLAWRLAARVPLTRERERDEAKTM